jgi:DNA-binding transcriptional LysR family regulator
MQWDDLKYVLALARSITMSAAAIELGVNHSTVSRRIAAFQKKLGVQLFIATPEGWDVTAEGAEMVTTAEVIESQVMELDRALLGRDENLAGSLRVSALDAFLIWMAADFVRFSQRYPRIKLELSAQNLPVNLTRREADIAIRVTNTPPESLIGRKVGRLPYAAYVQRELAEVVDATPGDWTSAELKRLPWLGWDARLGAVVTERWIAETVGVDCVRARYDSTPTMVNHMRLGMGAALLPMYLVAGDPDVVQITPPLNGFSIDVWLLTHPDLRQTARVRAFMDFFEDVLAEQFNRGTSIP